MAIDSRKAEEYGQKILKQFQKDPTKLGPHEARLARKYHESSSEADSIDQTVRQINGQVHQAQARVRSLELQYNEQIGKAAAFLEYIIALKFDGDNGTASQPKKETKSPAQAPTQRKAKARGKKISKKVKKSKAST